MTPNAKPEEADTGCTRHACASNATRLSVSGDVHARAPLRAAVLNGPLTPRWPWESPPPRSRIFGIAIFGVLWDALLAACHWFSNHPWILWDADGP